MLLAASLLYWLGIDRQPLGWDAAGHFIDSIKVYDLLQGGIGGLLPAILENSYYPPLVKLITVPFYALFGVSTDVAVAGTNIVFLAILVFSVYGIGNHARGPLAGALSAIIVSAYPSIGLLSKVYMIDLPLAAMVALSAYCLLLAGDFQKRPYSLLFGLTLGLGMLTKWTFVIFIAGPALYAFYRAFRSAGKPERPAIAKNVLLLLAAGAAVSAAWYAQNLGIFLELFKHSGIDTYAQQYPALLANGMSPAFAILAVAMFFYLLTAKRKDTPLAILALWIVLPFVVLSLQANRDHRFIAPALPAFALISGVGVATIKNAKIRAALIVLVVATCLAMFLGTSYVQSVGLDGATIGSTALFGPYVHYPSAADWQEETVFDAIVEDSGKSVTRVCEIPENPSITGPLWYYPYIRHVDVTSYSGGYNPFLIFDSDYVVTLKDGQGYWGPNDSRHIDAKAHYAQYLLEQNIADFTLLREIALPDGSTLLIYKHTYSPSQNGSPSHATLVDYSDQVRLVGYDIRPLAANKSTEMAIFGREIDAYEIVYYWMPLKTMDENYTISVHFVDANGTIRLQRDHEPFGGAYPTSRWKVGEVVQEKCIVVMPWTMDSGTYALGVGLYVPGGGALLPDRLADGNNAARALIGNVTFVNEIPESYASLPDNLKV